VKAWLQPLLIPYLLEAYKIVRSQHGLPPVAPPSPSALSPTTSLHSLSSQNNNSTPDTPSSSSEPSPRSTSPSPLSLDVPEGHVTVGHLALFNQYLQKTNREIEWVYSDGDGYGFDGFLGDDKKPGEQGSKLQDGKGLGQDGGGMLSPPRRGTKTTPVWTVTAFVGGVDYGSGMGTSKKAARHEAAKKGLIKLGIVV